MQRFTKLIFGHTDEAGLRVLREVFASIGKKNGKTGFAAAVAMTKLLLEEEQRDYVVLLAENRAQARIAYDGMVAMVRADEEFARRFEIVDHRHTLRYPATQSRATAVAADVASLVGFNPALAVVDELHLLGRTPKGAKLVNQVRTGSVARREPMLFIISTAPPERSAGIFAVDAWRRRAGSSPAKKSTRGFSRGCARFPSTSTRKTRQTGIGQTPASATR